MKRFLGMVALLLAVPVSAQDSTDYVDAVEARLAGDAATAVKLLDRWISEHPEDADALVQRGYSWLALGNNAAARKDFEAALAIAPNYTDAAVGLERARARPTGSERRGFILVEAAYSDPGSGTKDWREVGLVTQFPVARTVLAGVDATYFERFGRTDVELGGRLDMRASEQVTLRMRIGGTPDADFRPEIALAGGTDLRLRGGPQATILSLDGSFQRFPLQDVVTINPEVTQYLGTGASWVTLRGIGTIVDGGGLEVGGLARFDTMPDDRQRIFVGVADGPDTDLGIVTRVTSIFGGAEFPLAGDVSITPSLAHEWRESGGERTEVRIGLKVGL